MSHQPELGPIYCRIGADGVAVVVSPPKHACKGAKRGRKPYAGPPREAVTVQLPIALVDEIRRESKRAGVKFIDLVTGILLAAMLETKNNNKNQ